MLRISLLVLIGLFLVGCGGGTIPVTPPHNSGSSSGTGSSSGSSGSSSAGSGSSASGTSSSGSSSGGSSGSGSSGSSGSTGNGVPSGVVAPSSFSFSGYNWGTDGGTAPPVGNVNGNVGTFDPNNVTVGSELVLALTQTNNGSGIKSVGSEVISKQTFTYGTFEFTSRVSEALSGSDAGGFLYATNSETEIDMEQVGNKPDAVDCTNWHGESDFQDTEITGYDQGNSHDFKIVWAPSHVDWYVDGNLVVSHSQSVPSTPAPFLFNILGTNSSSWGGTATIGPTRYMYISNFKYTPQ
jgi:Glycosyl hydrolases family 16